MSNDTPLTISIPYPCVMPRGEGINSTGSYGDILKARVPREEYMQVERVSASLGLTVSMFTRWCAVYAAKTLEKKDVRDDCS